MDAVDHTFEDIKVGDFASFERTITQADIADFARLSGDHNPLHTDATYAATTQFGRSVVHGMFLGALCSQLVGMYLPGKRCLYLSQTLQFKKPVFVGETVSVNGTVTHKSEATRMLTLVITITRAHDTVVQGEARVQVLPQLY